MQPITERLVIWRNNLDENGFVEEKSLDCSVWELTETKTVCLANGISDVKKRFPYAMMDCNRLAKIVRSYGDKW